ncbi:MAG: acyl-CoA dehydrogenase family protein, partial [Pseudonocardiaceae bacterium]
MRRRLFEAEHDAFRESVRAFLDKEVIPHLVAWEAAGIVPRDLFLRAGSSGFLGMAIPEEFGGGGVADFRFNAVLGEEVMHAGAAASGL